MWPTHRSSSLLSSCLSSDKKQYRNKHFEDRPQETKTKQFAWKINRKVYLIAGNVEMKIKC